jgi:hypothetical protein
MPWMPARSTAFTTWLAIIRRVAPAVMPARICATVAKVRPQAPSSSWRLSSCGDMVVLPCGAMSTPWPLAKRCIQPRLCFMADCLTMASGSGRSPLSTFQPCLAMSERRTGPLLWGKPL